MSKLVNWGHWMVGILLGLSGLGSLTDGTISLIHGVRNVLHGSSVSFYSVYLALLWSVATLLCAWGILRWRLWAHYLALFFSVVDLVVATTALVLIRSGALEIESTCAVILLLLITVWLLLPAVRRQYVQRSLAI